MAKKPATIQGEKRGKTVLSIVFAVVAIVYLLPIFLVLMNSFKANAYVNTETFALPNEESYVGFANYIKGMTFGNYPFAKSVGYSLFITIVSSALILVCTSMAAWYIARVGSAFSKIVYYLCVFSMVVPFQMVMFTLPKTADTLHLNTPWTIPIIYLGFGAGLAVFMFSGFVKSIPLSIEEAAAIDGCGPVKTFFSVVLPMMKPTMISVGVLEIMWVWNDYLLPYLVLDRKKYMTIPIHIQYLKGSYGSVDMGCNNGPDPAEHPARHHLLPDLPEVHHQRCSCRCGEGIKTHQRPAAVRSRPFPMSAPFSGAGVSAKTKNWAAQTAAQQRLI